MKLLMWNCRGLGTASAIRSLKDVVSSSSPQIIGLVETKMNNSKWQLIRSILGFQNYFSVSPRGRSGGLATLWRNDIDVTIRYYSFHHIDFTIKHIVEFRATLFYGAPMASQRFNSWNLMRRLSQLSSLPWCIFGDFNEILRYSEASRNATNRMHFINQFKAAVRDCSLSDLGYKGYRYTYSNRRRGFQETRCRLDRALVCQEWRSMFPRATVTHLVAHPDHCPILIQLRSDTKWQNFILRQCGSEILIYLQLLPMLGVLDQIIVVLLSAGCLTLVSVYKIGTGDPLAMLIFS
ncbi:unnamed protein product [Rhodiola kirilowii]